MHVVMRNIHKAFGNNQVLKGVDLELHPGEVHALMGENGAGKSTMMNILTGLLKKDEGAIHIDGEERYFDNPKEAELFGVSFIHQELIVWPELSIVENMFMGKEISRYGFNDQREMKKLVGEALNSLDVSMNLDTPMRNLSIGQQQLVEIAKTLLNDTQVLIMDEPTAALTGQEIQLLFDIIRSLTSRGVAIVYISHRMEEIFEISDRVTVMRDGVSVSTKLTSETTQDEIVKNMVGRELEDYYPDHPTEIGEVLLEVKNLNREGVLKNINFNVRSGEILGFAGLMGAGRTEVMRAIFGLDPVDSMELALNGKTIQNRTPQEAVKHGFGFLTEDRKNEGLILDFPIRDNVSLTSFQEFSTNGWIHPTQEDEFVQLLVDRLRVKTTDIYQEVGSLSGGNQQKVVLAKWVGAGTQVLILDEPTRGVDVGAKREIYLLMKELADRGVGIIMVSSDLPEIIGISDRVLVVHEGRINGELYKEELTEEKIMTYATGGK